MTKLRNLLLVDVMKSIFQLPDNIARDISRRLPDRTAVALQGANRRSEGMYPRNQNFVERLSKLLTYVQTHSDDPDVDDNYSTNLCVHVYTAHGGDYSVSFYEHERQFVVDGRVHSYEDVLRMFAPLSGHVTGMRVMNESGFQPHAAICAGTIKLNFPAPDFTMEGRNLLC